MKVKQFVVFVLLVSLSCSIIIMTSCSTKKSKSSNESFSDQLKTTTENISKEGEKIADEFSDQVDKTTKNISKEGEKVVDKFNETKEEFVSNMDDSLNQLERKMEDLKLKAEAKGPKENAEYKQFRAQWDEKVADLREKLKAASEDSEDAWIELRKGFSKAYDELSDSFQKAYDKYQ